MRPIESDGNRLPGFVLEGSMEFGAIIAGLDIIIGPEDTPQTETIRRARTCQRILQADVDFESIVTAASGSSDTEEATDTLVMRPVTNPDYLRVITYGLVVAHRQSPDPILQSTAENMLNTIDRIQQGLPPEPDEGL